MKCISILIGNFIIIGLQLYSLYICYYFFNNISMNTIYLSNILDNWGSRPYLNIELFDNDCPFNYEPIIINKFQLNCYNDLEKDSLPEEKFNSSILRNHLNKTLCIKKLSTFGYFKKNFKRKCGKEEKDCGYLDTLGHKLCLVNTKSCPINGISIKHKNENEDLHLITYESNKNLKDNHFLTNSSQVNNSKKYTKEININQNYSIVFTRENKNSLSTIVIDIDIISEFKKNNLNCNYLIPFDNSDKKRISSSLRNSAIIKENYKVDKQNNSQMIYHNHKYSIEYRPFIGWKESCIKNKMSTPDRVELLYHRLIKIKENNEKLRFVNFFFTLFVVSIVLIYYPCKCDINDIWHYVYLSITYILYIIFSVPLLLQNISICYRILYHEKENIDISNCSDIHTNLKLSQIENNVNFIFLMDFGLFGLTLVSLAFSTIQMLCINVEETKKSMNENTHNSLKSLKENNKSFLKEETKK